MRAPRCNSCMHACFWHRLQATVRGRIEQLTAQLEATGGDVSQVDDMRLQVHKAAERFRFEKDALARAVDDVKAANEKVSRRAVATVPAGTHALRRWSTCRTTSRS